MGTNMDDVREAAICGILSLAYYALSALLWIYETLLAAKAQALSGVAHYVDRLPVASCLSSFLQPSGSAPGLAPAPPRVLGVVLRDAAGPCSVEQACEIVVW